jgi:hypothetical protein
VNLIVFWHFLLGAGEMIHIFVSMEKKTAIIMVKILGTTLQNSVAWDLCIPDTWNC